MHYFTSLYLTTWVEGRHCELC